MDKDAAGGWIGSGPATPRDDCPEMGGWGSGWNSEGT
jgi:hypothetical protein